MKNIAAHVSISVSLSYEIIISARYYNTTKIPMNKIGANKYFILAAVYISFVTNNGAIGLKQAKAIDRNN